MQDKPGPLDLDFRAMELRILAALGPKPRIKLNTLLRTQRTAWADRWMCTGMNADGTNCIGVGVTPRGRERHPFLLRALGGQRAQHVGARLTLTGATVPGVPDVMVLASWRGCRVAGPKPSCRRALPPTCLLWAGRFK